MNCIFRLSGVLYFGCIVILLSACNSGNNNSLDEILEVEVPLDTMVTKETMSDIIQAVPSPIELASAIRENGSTFTREFLNKVENADGYTSNFKRALNLGVYGADLAYINVYEKSKIGEGYLGAIKRLTDELKVGQFFDFKKMSEIAEKGENIDSIITLSTVGFERMDKYLNQNNRGNQSVLIICGGWIEVLFITAQVYENSTVKSGDLKERLGEQKLILEDLIVLLNMFASEPHFKEFINLFYELRTAYEGVTIEYHFESSESSQEGDALIINSNSNSEVIISNKEMSDITRVIKKIRNEIVQ